MLLSGRQQIVEGWCLGGRGNALKCCVQRFESRAITLEHGKNCLIVRLSERCHISRKKSGLQESAVIVAGEVCARTRELNATLGHA